MLAFIGQTGNQEHAYIEEMLTCELLKLEQIENPGLAIIGDKRKADIAMIDNLLQRL